MTLLFDIISALYFQKNPTNTVLQCKNDILANATDLIACGVTIDPPQKMFYTGFLLNP